MAEVAATEIMPRFRNLAVDDVEMKGANDPVTVADKAAEAALTERLTVLFPGSVVIGEEGVAADPTILSRFGGDHDVWVIDPIDGTRNFTEGRPEFAVMIALVRDKQTVGAWIHDPNSGDTLAAERGGGVWLRGRRMRLAGHEPGAPKVGIFGPRLQQKLSRPELAAALQPLVIPEATSVAAFDYGRLFTGDAVFADSDASRAAYLLYRRSKPWDHVPGLLMLAEAGGYAADLTGKPYDMQDSADGLLIAPDKASWESVYRILEPAITKKSAA